MSTLCSRPIHPTDRFESPRIKRFSRIPSPRDNGLTSVGLGFMVGTRNAGRIFRGAKFLLPNSPADEGCDEEDWNAMGSRRDGALRHGVGGLGPGNTKAGIPRPEPDSGAARSGPGSPDDARGKGHAIGEPGAGHSTAQ